MRSSTLGSAMSDATKDVLEQAFVGGAGGDPEYGEERAASLWGDAWRLLKRRVVFWIAVGLIALFTAMAIAPQMFVAPSPATHDPTECQLRNDETGEFQDRLPPSRDHWFGTDVQGCDYYARVIYGARVSIVIGIGVTALAGVLGLILGGLAGFYGGAIDQGISRFVDVLFAIPFLVVAILFLNAIARPGSRHLGHVLLVLGVFGWPTLSRIFRASVIQERNQDYVEAARAIGASNRRILVRHILPNAIAPAIVYATIAIGGVIAAEATLSFLGVGLQLPAISWGLMINTAQTRILTDPHLLFFPGVALSLTVLGFLLLGDVVRDALDPRLR
jgi:oligopeptide transport system permease protein